MPSDQNRENRALLEVEGLTIHFGAPDRPVRAVDGVSFSISAGEVVALVGESGCGKSATALALARLLPEPAARYVAGSIRLLGSDVLRADERALRAIRGERVAYVFQEPAVALNPVLTIGFQLDEALRGCHSNEERRAKRAHLLRSVGLDDTDRVSRAYPHELSGGMQQRAVIAMALAGNPKLLVADEPTTALDVTVQAQVLEVLMRVQREQGMGMLFITHNLALVARVAQRVLVMYAGQIVEEGRVEEVLRKPRHPYTCALIRAIPRLGGEKGRLEGIPGAVPNAADYPTGCRFHPRCSMARPDCSKVMPSMLDGVRCPYAQRAQD